MKRFFSIFLVVAVSCTLFACGKSQNSKSEKEYYEIAKSILTDYYERVYTGAEKNPDISEFQSEELNVYVEEQIQKRQSVVQTIGGYVKDIKLSFSQEACENNEEKIILSVNTQASFQYPQVQEKTEFGETSVFEIQKKDEKYIVTGWKMTGAGSDDFMFPAQTD